MTCQTSFKIISPATKVCDARETPRCLYPDFALDSSHSPAAGAGFLSDNNSPSNFHSNFVNPAVDNVIHSNGALPGNFPGFDLDPPGGVGSRAQASFPGIDLDSNFVPIPHMDPPGILSDSPEPELDIPPVQANATRVLPDFLSDSAVNTLDARVNLGSGSPASLSDEFLCHNGDLEVELRRVSNPPILLNDNSA